MAREQATVTALRPRTGGRSGGPPVVVREAVDAFLAAPRCNESATTRRAYGDVLRRVAMQIGEDRPLVSVDDNDVGDALLELWAAAKPSTWNRNRAAVGSWLTWS